MNLLLAVLGYVCVLAATEDELNLLIAALGLLLLAWAALREVRRGYICRTTPTRRWF